MQNNWGIPETYKQTIELLETHKVIPQNLSENLKNLVSMRNILVHPYIDADYDILWNSLQRISSDARSYVSFMREYSNQK
ncbi:MAG: type VII toxin-antitoxin system HepT family RNase toxin [Promethearchaeia archaeon]